MKCMVYESVTMEIRISKCNHNNPLWLPGLLIIQIVLLSSTVIASKLEGLQGSYSVLREPRLDLLHTSRDAGAVLHFYNADTLSINGAVEKAVDCTVTGGHLEKNADGWEAVTSVVLKNNPFTEKWSAPKGFAVYDSDNTLQTRTTYTVSYEVEGNLTCRDTLGRGLVSNTILLRSKNAESVIVRFSGLSTEELRDVPKEYAEHSYSKQIGRLLSVEHKPEPEAVVRVSYYTESGEFDQNKLLTDVTQLTEFIIKERKNITVKYVRSTRCCLPVEEGNFTWPMTLAGRSATPDNPCVDNNGTPVPRRQCLGDFFDGVYWDVLPQRPHVCLDPSARVTRLQNITKTLSKKDFIEILSKEIADGPTFAPVEIYFVSEALRKTADELSKSSSDISTPNISLVVNILNAVLHSGKDTVKMADDSYGSSGIILESIDKLLVAAASPMPTPVSMMHFSAFASTPGTGIQGFAYIPDRTLKGIGKMVPFDRKNTLISVLRQRPNVLAYLKDETVDYGITSTLFEDDSLFSAAANSKMQLQGPVFGMKLFQKGGEDLEDQKPILMTVQFIHDRNKPPGVHCVAWEPSRVGGWSSNICTMLGNSKVARMTICLCTILTSLDMYFTIATDEDRIEIPVSQVRFDLLPLRSNVGALLYVYNAHHIKFSDPLENAFSCYISEENYETTNPFPPNTKESVKLQTVANLKYGIGQELTILNVSYSGEGYFQCKDTIGLGLVSNKIQLLIQNTAVLNFSGRHSYSVDGFTQEYVRKHASDFNISNLATQKENSVLLRVSQSSENNPVDFIKSLKSFSLELAASFNWSLISIKSNRLCLMHEEGTFTWPNTKLGRLATPTNPCIDPHGAPIPARRCLGDHFTGMYWDEVPQRPDPCVEPSQRVQRLQNLTTQTTKRDVFKELLETIEGGPILTVVEATLLSEALKNAADEISDPDSDAPKPNITVIGEMVNAVIEAELEVYTEKNSTVSSEVILDSIDKLLEKASTETPIPVKTTHFSAIAAAPGSRYRGFAAVTDTSTPGQGDILPISWNRTVEDVLELSPNVAAFLLNGPEDVGVSYTSFKDDTLFTGEERDEESRVISPVVGLKMFRKEGEDVSRAPNILVLILFSHDIDGNKGHRDCHFWDSKSGGRWSKEGCARVLPCDLPDTISTDMDACLCTHLTHFAMLISNADTVMTEEDILHVLTVIGCSISTVCLFGLFLVAVFSPQWRRGASKKVQLNLSASLAMLMASYLAVASLGECPASVAACVAMGAVVHYSVLASFSWMLVAAVLQVIRLTPSRAMDARRRAGTHLVLRASVFGWGMPLIPVAATLIAGTDLYVRRPNSALCYPRGRAFYTAVLFPVALAVTLNTFVFVWLMRSLFCNRRGGMRVHQGATRRQALRRFFAALFLFSLLGITWLSGIAMEVTITSETVTRVLAYAFCATATLQGTFLFVFFVVCERRPGQNLCGAFSFVKTGSSRTGYSTKFDSSVSEKTTTNPEISGVSAYNQPK